MHFLFEQSSLNFDGKVITDYIKSHGKTLPKTKLFNISKLEGSRSLLSIFPFLEFHHEAYHLFHLRTPFHSEETIVQQSPILDQRQFYYFLLFLKF
jgi:hypothetical protein